MRQHDIRVTANRCHETLPRWYSTKRQKLSHAVKKRCNFLTQGAIMKRLLRFRVTYIMYSIHMIHSLCEAGSNHNFNSKSKIFQIYFKFKALPCPPWAGWRPSWQRGRPRCPASPCWGWWPGGPRTSAGIPPGQPIVVSFRQMCRVFFCVVCSVSCVKFTVV